MTLEQQYLRNRIRHAPISARSIPLSEYCISVMAELRAHPAEHLATINGYVVRVLTEVTQ